MLLVSAGDPSRSTDSPSVEIEDLDFAGRRCPVKAIAGLTSLLAPGGSNR